jgi:hypothetical protein
MRNDEEPPVAKLLEDFHSVVLSLSLSRTHLPGLSSLSMLEDIVIHQLDIRRPLEQPRRIPNGRTIPVATDLGTNRFFPGPKLFQDIRAVATDARTGRPATVWMSPGQSRRFCSQWPAATPRSTRSKVTDDVSA